MTSMRPARRRFRTTALALAGTILLTVAAAPATQAAGAVRAASPTGFSIPFTGPARYLPLAPTETTETTETTAASQLHQAIGQQAADALAARIGLRRSTSLTEQQYLEFISGQGVGGDPASAALVDASVKILTNTTGHPLYSVVDGVLTPTVLASYGLFVTKDGWLESPAYQTAPTRLVNTVIAPGGYMGQWMTANGATSSLIALYRSAYLVEAAFGFVCQQISGQAQLAPNTKNGTSSEVGMSMAPALWLTNFALIYTLNPALAAEMPAWWAPIPATVATAILTSPTGRVRYSDYASALH
ncbi:hypothetical protein ABH935_001414 [Catenulispora sp. GAS73]|uniref:hypothetical protein n=1 Tax=Catenulispora sp. GAS73 TaxID=3156269 RepID=UPI0035123F70